MAIIGAELDLGAGRRGVDMGPSAIRYAGLGERLAALGIPCHDWGNVHTQIRETTDPGNPECPVPHSDPGDVRADRRAGALGGRGRPDAARARRRPLGRDRDDRRPRLAARAGRGALVRCPRRPEHPRDDPERKRPRDGARGGARASRSRLRKRPLAATGGRPEHVAVVGVRSLDPGERLFVKENDLPVYTISTSTAAASSPVLREALERVSSAPFVHVSVDLDFVDPDVAPGVGSPVRGGLSYREAHLMMELVADSGLELLDLVEVNPILDHENETARLAVAPRARRGSSSARREGRPVRRCRPLFDDRGPSTPGTSRRATKAQASWRRSS